MNNLRKLLLAMGGVVKTPCVSLAETGYIEAADHATIQNLQDAAITAEAWIRVGTTSSYPVLIGKTDFANKDVGWFLFGNRGAAKLYGRVTCATTTYNAQIDTWAIDGLWHHYAITFDDAGDRRARLFRDGLLIATSGANVGAIVSDIGETMRFGHQMIGDVGWCRVSNVIRYTTTFTPALRKSPPANDANTVRLYRVDEMTGTAIVDYSSNAINATLVNGTWIKK